MPSVTAITVSQFSRLVGLPQGSAAVDVRIDDDLIQTLAACCAAGVLLHLVGALA